MIFFLQKCLESIHIQDVNAVNTVINAEAMHL
jgi:hypothetical protein